MNIYNVEFAGVTRGCDYWSDRHLTYAEYADGTALSEDELVNATDDFIITHFLD